MLFSFYSTAVVFGTLLISNTCAQSNPDNIVDSSKRARLAASSLMQWYDASSGLWETTGWWNAANILTMLGNFAQADPEDVYLVTLARTVFAVALRHAPTKNPNPEAERPDNSTVKTLRSLRVGTGYHKIVDPTTHVPHAVYPDGWSISSDRSFNLTALASQIDNDPKLAAFIPDPYDFLDGYYDDDLWWALAWIKAYDVTDYEPYLTLAEGIFNAVSKVWPTTCNNGGIYWNSDKKYVNAIANELFFSTAAHLANRAYDEDDYYQKWAERSLSWFLDLGMLSSNGTINDGLDENCQNNHGDVWSYNQGVILGGLVEMHEIDYNNTYLGLGLYIAYTAIEVLTSPYPGFKYTLTDPCEPNDCGADGTQFKGIFMRNLMSLWGATKDKLLGDYISANAFNIWHYDREIGAQGHVVFGVQWEKFSGIANASTQSSAMDALVADIVVTKADLLHKF